MKRRITRQLQLGSVFIGGDAPVSVQSMTNTVSYTHLTLPTTERV